MRYEEIIQRRVARELHPGTLVNLGIGLPTGVCQLSCRRMEFCFSPRTASSEWARVLPKAWNIPS